MVGGLVFRKGQSTNVTSRLKGARINKTHTGDRAASDLSRADLLDQRRQRLTIATARTIVVPRSRTVINTYRVSLDTEKIVEKRCVSMELRDVN